MAERFGFLKGMDNRAEAGKAAKPQLQALTVITLPDIKNSSNEKTENAYGLRTKPTIDLKAAFSFV